MVKVTYHNRLTNALETKVLAGSKEAFIRLYSLPDQRFIEMHFHDQSKTSSILDLSHPFYHGLNLYPSKRKPLFP